MSPTKKLIELDILKCFERGFDVIFEGNFRPDTHRDLLERLFSQHPVDNHVFYLDVSFEETLRRHGTREQIISEAADARAVRVRDATRPCVRVDRP